MQKFQARHNSTCIFENMLMSFYQETRPDCKIEIFSHLVNRRQSTVLMWLVIVITGIAFWSFLKAFKQKLFHLLECWVQLILTQRKKTKNLFFSRPIIVDIEGFKCGKKPFIVKKFSVCSAYTIDTIHFLPPVQFNKLSKEEKKHTTGI